MDACVHGCQTVQLYLQTADSPGGTQLGWRAAMRAMQGTRADGRVCHARGGSRRSRSRGTGSHRALRTRAHERGASAPDSRLCGRGGRTCSQRRGRLSERLVRGRVAARKSRRRPRAGHDGEDDGCEEYEPEKSVARWPEWDCINGSSSPGCANATALTWLPALPTPPSARSTRWRRPR